MILGLHHVAISVPDLDAACAFYVDTLGFEHDFGGEWDGDRPEADAVIGIAGTAARVRMLRAGGARLELWEYLDPRPEPLDPAYSPADHGLAHICIDVTDIDAEHARLSTAGMTFVGPPVRLANATAVYGRDPFGNIVELYEAHG